MADGGGKPAHLFGNRRRLKSRRLPTASVIRLSTRAGDAHWYCRPLTSYYRYGDGLGRREGNITVRLFKVLGAEDAWKPRMTIDVVCELWRYS